jgi:hypothetical protein
MSLGSDLCHCEEQSDEAISVEDNETTAHVSDTHNYEKGILVNSNHNTEI